jgi:hypothetical protein
MKANVSTDAVLAPGMDEQEKSLRTVTALSLPAKEKRDFRLGAID